MIPASLVNTVKTLGKVGLGTALAAPFLAGPAAALSEQYVKPLTGRKTDEEKMLDRAVRGPTMAQQARRMQRLQATMAYNQEVLATQHPSLYARLLAGRKLPVGSIVYGGRPKTENVEAAAYAMATGAFGQNQGSGMGGIITP